MRISDWRSDVGSSDLLVFLAFYGITACIAPTCLFARPAQLVASPGETARAFGVTMSGRNLGVLSGPLLLALAVEASGGWLAGSLLFAALTTDRKSTRLNSRH